MVNVLKRITISYITDNDLKLFRKTIEEELDTKGVVVILQYNMSFQNPSDDKSIMGLDLRKHVIGVGPCAVVLGISTI